jgi:hypothetical protein
MLRYRLVDQRVPAMCRSLAAALLDDPEADLYLDAAELTEGAPSE